MSIPKVIYQTFITNKLPFVSRLYIGLMQKINASFTYEFYDDARIERFLKEAYEPYMFEAYNKLAIGAAKADFFRYAILYKFGGVYLDIDGYTIKSLDKIILEGDEAIITREKNHPEFYSQFGLIYGKEHPFLAKTLEMVIDNINNNRYPNDVHKMTGPAVYSDAINYCIQNGTAGRYRIFGLDYNGYLKPKHLLNKRLYENKKRDHWKYQQLSKPVLKISS